MRHGVFGPIGKRAPARFAGAALALAAAWAAAGSAQALGRPEGRYYVDIAYAAGVLQPDTDDSHFSVRSEDADGFKLALGHVISRNWSLEAFWTDLGETVMAPDDSVIQYVEYGLMAVYNTALAGRWDLGVKLGGALLDVKWEHDFTDEGKLGLAGGISLRLPFRKFWWIDLGYDAYTRDASAVSLGIGRYFGLAPDWGQTWLATHDSGEGADIKSAVIAAVDHESAERYAPARQLAVLPDRGVRYGADTVSADKIRTIAIADLPAPAPADDVVVRTAPLSDPGRGDAGFGPPPTGDGAVRLARLEWGPYSNLERAQRAARLAKRSVGARPSLARRQRQYWFRVNVPDSRVDATRARIDAALDAASLEPDGGQVPDAPSAGEWRVQLASLADAGRAERLRSELAARGYVVVLAPLRANGRRLQAVQLLVPSRGEAQRLKRLMDREYSVRSVVLPPP